MRDDANVMGPVEHLYVHIPFCAHRCGYCDFVTVTGHDEQMDAYCAAVLEEVATRGAGVLAHELRTVYLGGGTPSRLGATRLADLLDALPPAREERTVECNPEDVDDALAAVLAERGCRVSLGVQSFQAPLLATLERRTTPDAVAAAIARLRDHGVPSLSVDLIYGIPEEERTLLDDDLRRILEVAPDHISAYELEAKPGTRFAVHHGAALAAQAEQLEDHFGRVIETFEQAGYRWYEVASFARDRTHEGRHNRAYWEGRDYLGVGVGAVSTVAGLRSRNGPRLGAYLASPVSPPGEREPIDERTARVERLMLGLRLADGVPVAAVGDVVDPAGLARLGELGLAETDGDTLRLRRRGRMLLHACVGELLHDDAP